MTLRLTRLGRAAGAALAGACALVAVDESAAQCTVELDLQEPTLWGAHPPSRFGSAIQIDGQRMIVGADREESMSSTGDYSPTRGAAYVYRLSPGGPVLESRLAPPELFATHQEGLGRRVALSASLAAVSNGFAGLELYGLSDQGWRHAASLARRHQVISMDGGWLALGDQLTQNDDGSVGIVALYRVDSTGAMETQSLTPPELGLASFGGVVELFGNSLAVAADERVFVYLYDGVSWTLETTLNVVPLTTDDRFGESVSGGGDLLVVGALARGEAYVFRRGASGWAQEQVLTPPDPAALAFGREVATNGAFVAIESLVSTSRRVHVFEMSGTLWTALGEVSSPVQPEWDLGPGVLAIGVPFVISAGIGEGVVHVFANIADCDADGVLDQCQLENGMATDCNGNGLLDECDFAAGTSLDVNLNGLPDECETDCNNNGVPDAWELSQGDLPDVNGNGIPDGCEIDCDLDGVPDATQFVARPLRCACRIDAPRALTSDSHQFGAAMARDGDTLVVGAPYPRGAHVFVRHAHTWRQQQTLTCDPGCNIYFGAALSLEGARLLVGAPGGSGMVHAFEFDGSAWVNRQAIVPPFPLPDGRFGASIAMQGDLALVGAPGRVDRDRPGVVHVLRHQGESWNHRGVLPMTALIPDFGASVALAGDLAAVGSPRADVVAVSGPFGDQVGRTGVVHLFRYDGAAWFQEARVTCPDPYVDDAFGTAVVLDGARLFVGAPHPTETSASIGPSRATIYEFRRVGQDWILHERISASRSLGTAFAVDGDRLIGSVSFGNPFGGGSPTGTATILYEQAANQDWIGRTIVPDRFGQSLILDGDQALIGNKFSERVTIVNGLGDCNTNGALDACDIEAGLLPDANVNLIPDSCECVGDLDLNGAADVFDLLAFLDDWFDGSPDGDFDASGAADVFDLLGFLDAWFLGC